MGQALHYFANCSSCFGEISDPIAVLGILVAGLYWEISDPIAVLGMLVAGLYWEISDPIAVLGMLVAGLSWVITAWGMLVIGLSWETSDPIISTDGCVRHVNGRGSVILLHVGGRAVLRDQWSYSCVGHVDGRAVLRYPIAVWGMLMAGLSTVCIISTSKPPTGTCTLQVSLVCTHTACAQTRLH